MEKTIAYAKDHIAHRAFLAAIDFVPDDIVGFRNVESGRCLVFLQKVAVLYIPIKYEESWDGKTLCMKYTSPGLSYWLLGCID